MDDPIEEIEAQVIALIIRLNDDENKLVATVGNKKYTVEEIQKSTFFQEQYFEVKIVPATLKSPLRVVDFEADRTSYPNNKHPRAPCLLFWGPLFF